MNGLGYVEAVIASGQSLSSAVQIPPGCRVVGIQMSADWDAADLTFQAAEALAGTYNALHDSGTDTEVTVQAGADRHIGFLDAAQQAFYAVRFLKVRSGTTAAAVNQTADRTLRLMIRAK